MTGLFEFFYCLFSCRFRDDFIFASSSYFFSEAPEEMGCCYFEEKLGLLLKDDFLFLTLDFLEAIDKISFILGIPMIFNILKGFDIFSRPSIPQESLSFYGILTCFGVTVKLFMSKSYCETSEMDSAARTLSARY